MRYLIILLLSVAWLIVQMGCAHSPPKIPEAQSERFSADLGTIGVVSAQFQPEFKFKKPKGKLEGAAVGAGTGALIVLYIVSLGASSPAAIGVLYPPVAAGIGIATGAAALVGGTIGAISGESSKKINETEATLNEALGEPRLQETFRNLIHKAAKEQITPPLVLIDEMGPTSQDEKVDYHSLKERGVHTVLELKVLKFGLWGEKGINPHLSFFMTVNTKFIRVEDGYELYDHTFRFEGVPHKFVEWAVNNGEPFRKEYERCSQVLAAEIMEKLFSPSGETEIKKEVNGSQNDVETSDLNSW